MTKRDFPPIHPGEILLEDFLQPIAYSLRACVAPASSND